MGLNENWYCDEDLRTLRGSAEAAVGVPGLVVELGSWEGRSALMLATIFPDRPVLCVDLWPVNYMGLDKDVWPVFLENTQHLLNIQPIRRDIIEYCRSLQDPLAFVHVDADHSYEHVRDTLVLLKPLCAPGAILCGHDIRTPDVERAVREVLPTATQNHNVWTWKA